MAVRLSALLAGHPLPLGRFPVLISVRGWVDTRAIVRLEGLHRLKNQWPNRESNPWPSSLSHSASTNCATACPEGTEGNHKKKKLGWAGDEIRNGGLWNTSQGSLPVEPSWMVLYTSVRNYWISLLKYFTGPIKWRGEPAIVVCFFFDNIPSARCRNLRKWVHRPICWIQRRT
jgi:hypothetical protein